MVIAPHRVIRLVDIMATGLSFYIDSYDNEKEAHMAAIDSYNLLYEKDNYLFNRHMPAKVGNTFVVTISPTERFDIALYYAKKYIWVDGWGNPMIETTISCYDSIMTLGLFSSVVKIDILRGWKRLFPAYRNQIEDIIADLVLEELEHAG